MSIDWCQKCEKRLDTDFVEYQDDGTLLCDGCLDEIENEQEPDWKALAGELAEAIKAHRYDVWDCAVDHPTYGALYAALAKYEQEVRP